MGVRKSLFTLPFILSHEGRGSLLIDTLQLAVGWFIRFGRINVKILSGKDIWCPIERSLLIGREPMSGYGDTNPFHMKERRWKIICYSVMSY